MARQKRSCSAGTGGRGQRTGSSAKARPDGSAAIHRGTAARHPIETGQGGGGQGCGFRMEQKLSECCTGKELPPGRNPEHASPAEVRPDGIAAMHRDRVLQRNRDEDFAAKAAKICPEKPKQAFLHGKRTSVRPKNTVHAISAEAKQAEVAGDANSSPNRERDPKAQYAAGIGKRASHDGSVKMRASGQGRSCSRLPATTAAT